jgi:7,8-dihydropterin-6-yl-methyl-4-(beta-D-ribofuranosyl)aminobenzene 5'-phosphate synthase
MPGCFITNLRQPKHQDRGRNRDRQYRGNRAGQAQDVISRGRAKCKQIRSGRHTSKRKRDPNLLWSQPAPLGKFTLQYCNCWIAAAERGVPNSKEQPSDGPECRWSHRSQCSSIPYNGYLIRLCPIFLLCASAFAQITIVYDNTAARADLKSDWGFSAIVDFRGQRTLFDVGAKPEIFLQNLKHLGIDKISIQSTIISHEHSSRTGGIYKVLPAGLIYFLDGFSKPYPEASAVGLEVKRVKSPAAFGPGLYVTGDSEQALVIETSKGVVLLVSCAHPGIAKMVEAVEKERNVKTIRMIVGGLHMYEQSEEQIRPVVAELQKLNVQSVVLGHCTGDRAVRLFREAFKENFATTGAGKTIALE